MIQGILFVVLFGFFGGELAAFLGLPKLMGMIAVGIFLGPEFADLFPQALLSISEEIRLLALLIILFKAGLGLDKKKILAQGSVAIRLAFLPAVVEASVVALATRMIMGWDWLLCWLLGWIICAASPAVIVPLMLRLKAQGLGGDKGIPDLILTGGTASDATAITMFGITMAWIAGDFTGGWGMQILGIPVQVLGGIALGYLGARSILFTVNTLRITHTLIHRLIVALAMGIVMILFGDFLPFSSFLAIMVMGFTILERDPVLARQLRNYLDDLWVVGQIFLFVLIGAAVQIGAIGEAGWKGLAIIGIGLLVGRWLGIFLSTWKSNLNYKERLFMVIGDMAKATVQAAIGGLPLSAGIAHGETILAIAVLSILVSAPLGAWGTVWAAGRFLKKGTVDPTRVRVQETYKILVAFDDSPASEMALLQAARLARQIEARLYVLHVGKGEEGDLTHSHLMVIMENLASDIPYDVITQKGEAEEWITVLAKELKVDFVFMGKGNGERLGQVSHHVLRESSTPVVFLSNKNKEKNCDVS